MSSPFGQWILHQVLLLLLATTTNPIENASATPPPPRVMPVSWDYSTIETMVADLRQNEETYTFVLANFAGRVVGMNQWKADALSGAKKPSEVMSLSSEALLLLIMLNYWKFWEAQANEDPPSSSSGEATSVSGSVSSLSSAGSLTLYTRINNSSTKDGWSADGIRKFEALMTRVEEDRNSAHGKEFERKFQTRMKAHEEGRRSRKRRRSGTSGREQLTSIRHELSDEDSSSGSESESEAEAAGE